MESGCLISCDGEFFEVEVFILDRGPHPERTVTALAVVEDLEVLEDRVRELDAGSSTCDG
jgi:hypothetical protein